MKGTVFITGASSGFGRACARRYGREGWRLILAARRREPLEQLQSEFGAESVHIVTLDVRDRAAVFAAVAALPEPFRQVDVLVASAGLALGLEPAHRADLDDWETMVDTNIKGLMYTVHALLPGMVAADRGHIVTIGLHGGHLALPRRQLLRRHQGLCQKIRRESPRRSPRDQGQGDQHRAGDGGDRVLPRPVQGRHGSLRPGLPGDRTTHRPGHRRYRLVDNLAPGHVNVNSLEVMSIDQAWGPFAINRR